MSFKLRSGNKTPFKMMGSSPLKQTEDDGLSTSDADRIKKNTKRTKLQKYQDEVAYKESKLAREREAMETTPWNEDVKAETATMKNVQKGPKGDVDPDTGKVTNISGEDASVKTDVGEGGYDYGEDGNLDDKSRYDKNVNKYKTKTQIKEDDKQRKHQSKLYDSDQGKKRTYAEKYADKTQKLADKYQRAKGEGSFGLKFDWKKMLLSDSIAGGFSIERKQDLIADKLSKRAKKRRNYLDRQKGKTQRKNMSIEAGNNEIDEIVSELGNLTKNDPVANNDRIEELQKQIQNIQSKQKKSTKKRDKVKNKYKIKGRKNASGDVVRKEKKGNVDKDYNKRDYKKKQKRHGSK